MKRRDSILLVLCSLYFYYVWITRLFILYKNRWTDPNLTVHLVIASISLVAATVILVIGIRYWKQTPVKPENQ